MARTPRRPLQPGNLISSVRNRLFARLLLGGRRLCRAPAGPSRQRKAYVIAALALAGVAGVMAAGGFSGQPASTADAHARAGPENTVKGSTSKHGAGRHYDETWAAVTRIVANRTFPRPPHGHLPARDRLTPVATSGPQTSMPITPARYENTKAIVRQAFHKHMGLRSAVIAVATAMQESTLLNLPNGDQDSVGLFQQRPSAGWGTASQIRQPAYAASAFLGALRRYQAQDPGWASQPLWETAQGVQRSAFPSAYAKWEAQAARLVASVTKSLI